MGTKRGDPAPHSRGESSNLIRVRKVWVSDPDLKNSVEGACRALRSHSRERRSRVGHPLRTGTVFHFAGVFMTPGIVVMTGMIVADVLIFLVLFRAHN